MSNLKQYFEYEKNNLNTNEGDFLRILDNIDTRKAYYGVRVGGESSAFKKNKSVTEYFGWAFGVAGFSLAAFVFFINPSDKAPTVAIISKQDIETLKQKRAAAVKVIDSINSFENVNSYTESGAE